MKKLIYLLLVLLLPISLVSAQDNHNHHSDTETHDHGSHDDGDHEGHDMDDKDDTHDHGSHDHGDHGDMAMMDGAANTVMLGELAVKVEPLVTLDGEFVLGLRPEGMMMGDLELMATTPVGDIIMDAETSMNLTLLELGQAEAGVYRVSGNYDGAAFAFPVSIYQQSDAGTDAYLVLAPSPTLENRGMAEVFAYVMKDGENLHSNFMVNRRMAGMQHSTDDEQVQLMHTHFDDIYDSELGETPMSNQTPLGFSMVGTWQVELMLMGSDMQSFVFDVEMLEN